ncbi:ScpA family protein [Mechercharimyces sp. CAU 1602]|uniref:segregation and condensation protein A n=1 Tax=Mechercharimyces sp. CAU 1602 TaxID=2973933 RepID=UPI002161D7FF|nr:segregation/condensation protein A [Mechercharimyces sp. CAU 1602]MCS1350861.1 segregation/condensation protein A [Mechercharimyces sp. CAU 1602]
MDIKIKLETFEGPLDLLLQLIERSELDIYDVPIARITDQYLAVLDQMQERQWDVASEFLVMAATLLAIKSRMLLPRQDPLLEDSIMDDGLAMDPREELVQRLLEYKKYKRLAQELREKEGEWQQVYTRDPMDLTPYMEEPNPVQGIRSDDLLELFIGALRQQQERMEAEEPMTNMTREEISVSDRMDEILRTVQSIGEQTFTQLLSYEVWTRERVITTFLAVLELMKTKQIYCYQRSVFADVVITATREGESQS